jgi:MoaA/NifB/PqqE/SkfB family radical SAM enzyme
LTTRNPVEVCDSSYLREEKAYSGPDQFVENRSSQFNPVNEVRLDSLNVIWLEPTLKCNLECVHCYSSSNMDAQDNLNISDWIDVLSQAAKLGCKTVQIGGGEPTLFKGLAHLIEKAREMGYRYIVLFTNATLLTESDLDDFSAFNVELVTSFYSDVREVHDSITRRPGSFDRTVRGIKTVLNRGLTLEVSIVRMPQSNGRIEGAIEYLVGLGIQREKIAVGPVRNVGRGALIQKGPYLHTFPCDDCTIRGHLVVSSDGSVYPCILARQLKVGDVRREQLRDILNNQELIKFRTAKYETSRLRSHPRGIIQP